MTNDINESHVNCTIKTLRNLKSTQRQSAAGNKKAILTSSNTDNRKKTHNGKVRHIISLKQ